MKNHLFEAAFRRLQALSEYGPYADAFDTELETLKAAVALVEVYGKRTAMESRLADVEARQIRYLSQLADGAGL